MRRQTAERVVEVDELTIDGKKVRVQHVDLDLDAVSLDPRNPRIANTVDLGGTESAAEVERAVESLLWKDDDVKDLCRQIQINKGLIERIIVRQDGSVVEGNCRTVCYRRLRSAHSKDARWRRIPARVLPPEIAPRDIAILLGEMHVAGKNTWSPFEKAGHVYSMHKELGLTQDEIAQRLRMSKSKVNQLIRAFEVMKNKLLPRFPGPGSVRKFSYFEELFRQPELREWVANEPKAEDLFVDWVGTGKISQGTHVRELPAIVANDVAVRALEREGLVEAMKIVGEENPALASKLLQRMLDMTTALRTARIDEVRRVAEHRQAQHIVVELSKALEHFASLAGMGRD
jgi:hypothetical protein